MDRSFKASLDRWITSVPEPDLPPCCDECAKDDSACAECKD